MVSSGAFARRRRIDDDWASNAFVEQPRCQPKRGTAAIQHAAICGVLNAM
jgi:hypothetical protein